MYKTTFTVRGHSTFPFDMLRYDRCCPFEQEDVNNMCDATAICDIEVTLVHFSQNKKWEPTYDRWISFQWTVEGEPKTEKLP